MWPVAIYEATKITVDLGADTITVDAVNISEAGDNAPSTTVKKDSTGRIKPAGGKKKATLGIAVYNKAKGKGSGEKKGKVGKRARGGGKKGRKLPTPGGPVPPGAPGPDYDPPPGGWSPPGVLPGT